MDTSVNYAGFDQDIKNAFASLIDEFAFVFHKEYNGCYELSNPYCILRFTFDRGDTACNVRQLESDEPFGYGIYPVFRYLYPQDKTFDQGIKYEPRLQLLNYAEIIKSRLRNVILGDFSWLNGFLREEQRTNKMIGFIWNQVDKKDPIFIKFENGDVTWQKDLEEYLLKHNIIL